MSDIEFSPIQDRTFIFVYDYSPNKVVNDSNFFDDLGQRSKGQRSRSKIA